MRVDGSEPGLAVVTHERRDHARAADREGFASPAVIVELGRPEPSPGTYNARGTLDKAGAAPRSAEAPGGATAATTTPGEHTSARLNARADVAASTAGSLGVPEPLGVPANAQLNALMAASPEAAVAARTKLPTDAANLHAPSPTVLTGIQTLAVNALKQAERGNAAAEHEDEADLVRKDKEPPAPRGEQYRAPRARE